jgi:signal transduction histidine kinase
LADDLKQRDLHLTLAGLDDLPMIEADIEAIRKVFYHLLVNAINIRLTAGRLPSPGGR